MEAASTLGTRMASLAMAGLFVALCGCVATQQHRRASALEYLYPEGRISAPTELVQLRLPLRVGVAFAPDASGASDVFSEPQRREILRRVAAAFRDLPEVELVEVLPTHNLYPGGGFENLQQVAGLYGMNLVALVSYDQIQFQTPGRASILYWTLVGAYFVEAERLETHTLLDATVFDLPSRALLMSGSGSSIVRTRATPIEASEQLRLANVQGFEQATDDLIANMRIALDVFRENAKRGTVRGLGTPKLQVQRDTSVAQAGGTGAGALGPLELLGLAALGAAAALAARRAPRHG